MFRYSDLRLRKFAFEDIPLKIEWINNPANHMYLHYDLPLEYEKTCAWYERTKDDPNRFDAVIEYMGKPVGLIGLLNIDRKNKKAEGYTVIGDTGYQGKGIATRAGMLNTLVCFHDYGLNKLYAYTEIGNERALRLDLRKGFHVEGYLRHDLCMGERMVDRFVLGLCRESFSMPEGVYWEE